MGRFRMHGCGGRGFSFPEGLVAMPGGAAAERLGQGWAARNGAWGGGGRRLGPRSRRRRMFDAGDLRLVLLKLSPISRATLRPHPRDRDSPTRLRAEPGIVFRRRTMLQDMGLIEEERRGVAKLPARPRARPSFEKGGRVAACSAAREAGSDQRKPAARRSSARSHLLSRSAPRHPRRHGRGPPARDRRILDEPRRDRTAE